MSANQAQKEPRQKDWPDKDLKLYSELLRLKSEAHDAGDAPLEKHYAKLCRTLKFLHDGPELA